MSKTCKSSNEELFQSDNKTQPHESIMQESEYEKDFPSKFLENSTVQHENFQSETVDFNVNDHVVSKENTVNLTCLNNLNSTSIDYVSTNLQIMEEMNANETLNDNVSQLNFNIISTELTESNHIQSKNVSSEISHDNHSS